VTLGSLELETSYDTWRIMKVDIDMYAAKPFDYGTLAA